MPKVFEQLPAGWIAEGIDWGCISHNLYKFTLIYFACQAFPLAWLLLDPEYGFFRLDHLRPQRSRGHLAYLILK